MASPSERNDANFGRSNQEANRKSKIEFPRAALLSGFSFCYNSLIMKQPIIFVLRILMGWTFLWAFVDKLLGLGFATCRDAKTGVVDYLCSDAWLKGGSPTHGFLTYAVKGPFADYFHNLASQPMVDWLFMIGLGAIGLALILGVLLKLASYAGVLMLILMYLAASIWPANNPFLDEHIVYAVLLVGIAQAHPGLFRWRS